MEITIFEGKINYKWAIFNSYVTNYQRVCDTAPSGSDVTAPTARHLGCAM